MTTILPLALARKFRAIEDLGIRRRLVREALETLDTGSLARYMLYLLKHMEHPDNRALWLDMVIALTDVCCLSNEKRGEMVSATGLDSSHPLAYLLSDTLAAEPPRLVLHPDQEDLPLGVRKARARSKNRDVIRRLVFDGHPAVVAALVENDLVTEADVLRIASLRPQSSDVFRVLLESRRFGTREIVLAAMAQNPSCPLRIAMAVLPLLTRNHLHDIATATRLDPRLRKAASIIMRT